VFIILLDIIFGSSFRLTFLKKEGKGRKSRLEVEMGGEGFPSKPSLLSDEPRNLS